MCLCCIIIILIIIIITTITTITITTITITTITITTGDVNFDMIKMEGKAGGRLEETELIKGKCGVCVVYV